MDVKFKPYKTGMVTMKEKYPCGRGDSKKRNHVYYLCQCDCGKEFIVSGMSFPVTLIRVFLASIT